MIRIDGGGKERGGREEKKKRGTRNETNLPE